jgi:hypothetical protein
VGDEDIFVKKNNKKAKEEVMMFRLPLGKYDACGFCVRSSGLSRSMTMMTLTAWRPIFHHLIATGNISKEGSGMRVFHLRRINNLK